MAEIRRNTMPLRRPWKLTKKVQLNAWEATSRAMEIGGLGAIRWRRNALVLHRTSQMMPAAAPQNALGSARRRSASRHALQNVGRQCAQRVVRASTPRAATCSVESQTARWSAQSISAQAKTVLHARLNAASHNVTCSVQLRKKSSLVTTCAHSRNANGNARNHRSVPSLSAT